MNRRPLASKVRQRNQLTNVALYASRKTIHLYHLILPPKQY